MPSDKELKAEIVRLKAEISEAQKRERIRIEMIRVAKKQRLETANLKKELADLRNPKSTAFKRNLRRLGRLGGRAILLAGENIDKRFRAKIGAKRTIPKGEIGFKKVRGGYKIYIARREFDFAEDRRMLLLKINIIRRLQGKPKVRKL